jgi:hypothetical protein
MWREKGRYDSSACGDLAEQLTAAAAHLPADTKRRRSTPARGEDTIDTDTFGGGVNIRIAVAGPGACTCSRCALAFPFGSCNRAASATATIPTRRTFSTRPDANALRTGDFTPIRGYHEPRPDHIAVGADSNAGIAAPAARRTCQATTSTSDAEHPLTGCTCAASPSTASFQRLRHDRCAVRAAWCEPAVAGYPTLTATPSAVAVLVLVADGMQWRQGNGVKSGLGWQVDVVGMSFGIMPARPPKGRVLRSATPGPSLICPVAAARAGEGRPMDRPEPAAPTAYRPTACPHLQRYVTRRLRTAAAPAAACLAVPVSEQVRVQHWPVRRRRACRRVRRPRGDHGRSSGGRDQPR